MSGRVVNRGWLDSLRVVSTRKAFGLHQSPVTQPGEILFRRVVGAIDDPQILTPLVRSSHCDPFPLLQAVTNDILGRGEDAPEKTDARSPSTDNVAYAASSTDTQGRHLDPMPNRRYTEEGLREVSAPKRSSLEEVASTPLRALSSRPAPDLYPNPDEPEPSNASAIPCHFAQDLICNSLARLRLRPGYEL